MTAISRLSVATVVALLITGCGGGERGANQQNQVAPTAKAEELPSVTIGQTIAQSPEHRVLAQAIKTAGLEATFTGAQPYTLFAPTDAAFNALPGGSAALLRPEAKGQLVALITQHVVPGVVTAGDLSNAVSKGEGKAELATMGGGRIKVSQENGATIVTDPAGGRTRVTRADILQSNGVVHVVDGLIRPAQ